MKLAAVIGVILLMASGASIEARAWQPEEIEPLLPTDTEAGLALLGDAEAHRVQVLVGRIDGRKGERAALRRLAFREDAEYFYPASTIKLCAAVAAIEEVNRLARAHGEDLTLDSRVLVHPLAGGGEPFETTVGLDIRRIGLVSDNPAFNRLYDLIGPSRLNARMRELGLSGTRITHRLSVSLPEELQRRTPFIGFRTESGALAIQPRTGEPLPPPTHVPGLEVGRAHVRGGGLVESPMDFTHKNRTRLRDLQDLLVLVVRPDLAPPGVTLNITEAQRAALLDALTTYPGDSEEPFYDRVEYPDHHVKFLLPGLERVVAKERLRIVNKVGMAYGFTIENAYVEDTHSGRAFFVAAVVYTNANGVLNDDRYEYDSLALPFMADLGERLARELLIAD